MQKLQISYSAVYFAEDVPVQFEVNEIPSLLNYNFLHTHCIDDTTTDHSYLISTAILHMRYLPFC